MTNVSWPTRRRSNWRTTNTYSVFEKRLSRGRRWEIEQTHQGHASSSVVLLLAGDRIPLDSSFSVGSQGDGERAQENEASDSVAVGTGSSGGSLERVELVVGGSVEEEVLSDGKDFDQLLVEARHHAGPWSALGGSDEAVDVFS